MKAIVVEPSGAGWTVDVQGLINPMYFSSGRSAETVARDLAARLAAIGDGVQVEIRIRGGAVAGTYALFPRAANEDTAAVVSSLHR